jgi:hypothetical protein
MAVAFDTLKFAEKLEAGGFSTVQARAAAEAFAEATGQELATKADLGVLESSLRADNAALRADLGTLESSLRADNAALRAELKADMAAVRAELKGDIAAAKSDTLKWIIGAVGIQTVVILAALARLSSH